MLAEGANAQKNGNCFATRQYCYYLNMQCSFLIIASCRCSNSMNKASKVVLNPIILLNTIFKIKAVAIHMEGHVVFDKETIGAVHNNTCKM